MSEENELTKLRRENSDLRREKLRLEAWVENWQRDTQVLTCVYCGHAYPPGTPTHGSPVLTEHIKQCDKHPMKKVWDERNELRNALVTIVQEDELSKLRLMLKALGTLPDCPETRIGRIGLETLIKIRA